MASRVLSLLMILAFSLFQARAVHRHPNVFIPVSTATCQSGYAWMNNAEQRDPCLAVAYVLAPCHGDTWTQPALPPGSFYTPPNSTTATPCFCSWSAYNLMMACTLCQNVSYASELMTWSSFYQDCPSNYADEVFPQGYVLANNFSIPYWATIDPASWPSELFNITEAESYASQHHPDYYPGSNSSSNPSSSSSSSSSSSDLGAIIGGAVGGAAGLLLILVGGYFLYRRRQYRRLHGGGSAIPILNMEMPMKNMHTRWPSDPSTIFPPTLSSSPGLMSYQTTPSQGTGMSILSPTHYSSFHGSPPPPTETASFVTTGNTVVQRTRPIPMV